MESYTTRNYFLPSKVSLVTTCPRVHPPYFSSFTAFLKLALESVVSMVTLAETSPDLPSVSVATTSTSGAAPEGPAVGLDDLKMGFP